MTFYVLPLHGSCSLDKLSTWAEVRMTFLSQLSKDDDDLMTGYYYEDVLCHPQADILSHFCLMLAASQDSRMSVWWLKAEQLLFSRRLRLEMDVGDVIKSVRRLARHSWRLSDQKMWSEVYTVVHQILYTGILNHWLMVHNQHEPGNETCNVEGMFVPFSLVLPLVARREVELRSGHALINCSNMRSFLISLFKLVTRTRLSDLSNRDSLLNAVYEGREEGSNIKNLVDKMVHKFRDLQVVNSNIKRGRLRSVEIEKISKHLPFCMKILYKKLMRDYKLSHNERWQLSLFLKDIGLSVDEAELFWSQMYSKFKTSGGSLWTDKKAKYIYGIRHMYGLEGKRRDYSSRSCSSLSGDGMCPISDGNLPIFLKKEGLGPDVIADMEDLVKKSNGDPRTACLKLSSCLNIVTNFERPSELFLLGHSA